MRHARAMARVVVRWGRGRGEAVVLCSLHDESAPSCSPVSPLASALTKMIQWTYPQEVDGGHIEQSKTPEHQLCLRYCVAKVTVARMTVARKHSEVPTATKKNSTDLGIIGLSATRLTKLAKMVVLMTEKKTPATGPLSKK